MACMSVAGFVRGATGRRSVVVKAFEAGVETAFVIPLDDAEAFAEEVLDAVEYAREAA